jgi:hypothetical protein
MTFPDRSTLFPSLSFPSLLISVRTT